MEEQTKSKLGTQEYWNKHYQLEYENFQTHGDTGEIWFGKHTMKKIINWLNDNNIKKESKILDIGCGNGLFLVELHNEGYYNLYGIDYSNEAIILAESIAKKDKLNIKYSNCDVLKGITNKYDIIHDKGTLDAITLGDNPQESRQKYLKNVQKSLDENGLFIITSCNWTRMELDEQLDKYLEFFMEIPTTTKQFRFGGKTGNIVTTIIYKQIK